MNIDIWIDAPTNILRSLFYWTFSHEHTWSLWGQSGDLSHQPSQLDIEYGPTDI